MQLLPRYGACGGGCGVAATGTAGPDLLWKMRDMNPRLLLALPSPGPVFDGILASPGQGGGRWNEEQGLPSLGLLILFVTKMDGLECSHIRIYPPTTPNSSRTLSHTIQCRCPFIHWLTRGPMPSDLLKDENEVAPSNFMTSKAGMLHGKVSGLRIWFSPKVYIFQIASLIRRTKYTF